MGGASSRILEVAGRRFAENGYRGTSIEEIASEAEISRSSLFWHFGSKEGLLLAVVESTVGSWVSHIADAGEEQRGLAGLRAALVAVHRVHSENPGMARLATLLLSEAAATETSLIPIFTEVEQRMLGLWKKLLSEAADDGDLRPGVDPEKAAAFVNAANFGATQLWSLDPGQYDVAAMEAATLHMVDCL